MRVLKKKINDKKAFTLAEILITLGIIGVVAAITIPTLINNYQKNEYVTRLKKFYTTFNSALKQVTTAYSCIDDLKCTGLFASGTTNTTLGDELIKYFQISKSCGIAAGQKCWPAGVDENYDGSSGSTDMFDNSDYYKFVTADGMSVALLNYASLGMGDCVANWSLSGKGNSSQMCAIVMVDVNGLKGPNNYGRDVFNFRITNGKGALLYPGGGIDESRPIELCNNNNKSGYYCAGRIMEDGWQMNY